MISFLSLSESAYYLLRVSVTLNILTGLTSQAQSTCGLQPRYDMMFFKTLSLYSLTLCVSVYLGTQTAGQNSENEININDTILQFYHNCTCAPYYLCNAANRYMIAGRANLKPTEIECSNADYLCCKNTTSIEPDLTPEIILKATKPTVKPPGNVTTEGPQVRETGKCTWYCGEARTYINVRILNTDTESADTIPGEVPWMVEIFQKRKNAEQPYRFKCPGTLIHPKVVLTAAHCIVSVVKKPENLRVLASGKDIFQNLGVGPEDERNVANIIKHPQYNSGGLYNDIALLILDREYDFTDDNLLNGICLPKANQTFDGRTCIGVGWGRNANLENLPLKKVDVPVVDSQKCQDLVRKSEQGDDFNLHASFMCAGGEEGKDTCEGDGGGPLMCVDENRFVQAGIVSWGVGGKCGIVDEPGLYADVGKSVDWITDELKTIEITLKC